MKELRLTDKEFRTLVAAPLRRRLLKAGFRPGASHSTQESTFAIPVFLDLAGDIDVAREPDGSWTFVQEERAITDRCVDSALAHRDAIMAQYSTTKA